MKSFFHIIIGSMVLATAAHAAPAPLADSLTGCSGPSVSQFTSIEALPAPALSDAPSLPVFTAAAVGLDRPYRPAQTAIGADAWKPGDGSPVPTSPVPEPHTLALLSTVVLPLLGFCRRSRR